MVTTLINVLSDLSVDEPIAWGRVRIIPLRLQGMGGLEYVTLDDRACETVVSVEETSASGSVPELQVRNRGKSRVLIPEGSTLIGAKQNRVVNLSVVIAPESVTIIPVSCVERGRWRFMSPHFAASDFADSPLRAKMCKDAMASLKRAGKVHVDQGEVWSHVDGILHCAGASSPTSAYHALYNKWQPELADYEARLHLPENANGVAVEIDGMLQAVDLFDKPNTLHKLWPRLVRSYALAALRPKLPQGKKTDVRGFLERILSSEGESYGSVGVGTTIRLSNSEAVGAALMCEDHLVHLSVFANGETTHHQGTPPPLQARSNQPEGGPERAEQPRPWWRFWV